MICTEKYLNEWANKQVGNQPSIQLAHQQNTYVQIVPSIWKPTEFIYYSKFFSYHIFSSFFALFFAFFRLFFAYFHLFIYLFMNFMMSDLAAVFSYFIFLILSWNGML